MLISVITVVFNGEKTIERTIKSVLDQKFLDYEYIIQDGGSTDKTNQIVELYIDKFEGRLKWYSEKDKGIYDAMNKGIQKASGDYIWLVNADDYITPNAFNELYQNCNVLNFKQCVISGRMNIVDADSCELRYTSRQGSVDDYRNSCKKLKMGICHPATIVHRDVYNSIGLYDDRYYISADVDFCLRTYLNNVYVVFVTTVFTNMTDGGISNRFPVKKNMHDCMLRANKFCKTKAEKYKFVTWYFFRLLALKVVGFKK